MMHGVAGAPEPGRRGSSAQSDLAVGGVGDDDCFLVDAESDAIAFGHGGSGFYLDVG